MWLKNRFFQAIYGHSFLPYLNGGHCFGAGNCFFGVALNMLRSAHLNAALQGQHETARSVSLLVDRDLSRAEAALQVLTASQYLNSGDMKAFYEQAKTANQETTAWTFCWTKMVS